MDAVSIGIISMPVRTRVGRLFRYVKTKVGVKVLGGSNGLGTRFAVNRIPSRGYLELDVINRQRQLRAIVQSHPDHEFLSRRNGGQRVVFFWNACLEALVGRHIGGECYSKGEIQGCLGLLLFLSDAGQQIELRGRG